MAEYQPKHND